MESSLKLIKSILSNNKNENSNLRSTESQIKFIISSLSSQIHNLSSKKEDGESIN
jgi:hypothetical protein